MTAEQSFSFLIYHTFWHWQPAAEDLSCQVGQIVCREREVELGIQWKELRQGDSRSGETHDIQRILALPGNHNLPFPFSKICHHNRWYMSEEMHWIISYAEIS